MTTRSQRKPVVIVSNNSRAGVLAFLEVQGLCPLIAEVFGRPVHRPDLMKPNPTIVRADLDHLQVPAESTVLVGDSVSDIEVSGASRIPGVGLANRAGKRVPLATAGATTIIDSLRELLADPRPCQGLSLGSEVSLLCTGVMTSPCLIDLT